MENTKNQNRLLSILVSDVREQLLVIQNYLAKVRIELEKEEQEKLERLRKEASSRQTPKGSLIFNPETGEFEIYEGEGDIEEFPLVTVIPEVTFCGGVPLPEDEFPYSTDIHDLRNIRAIKAKINDLLATDKELSWESYRTMKRIAKKVQSMIDKAEKQKEERRRAEEVKKYGKQ